MFDFFIAENMCILVGSISSRDDRVSRRVNLSTIVNWMECGGLYQKPDNLWVSLCDIPFDKVVRNWKHLCRETFAYLKQKVRPRWIISNWVFTSHFTVGYDSPNYEDSLLLHLLSFSGKCWNCNSVSCFESHLWIRIRVSFSSFSSSLMVKNLPI